MQDTTQEATRAASAISIVIPVYNEQASVVKTVEAILEVLAPGDVPFEIIIVNDGSMDNTGQILQDLKRTHPQLIIVEHEINLGYGAALKSGISRSRFDRIMIIDADQTYSIHEIPRLMELAREYDMVVASRVGPAARIPLIRRPAKLILKWLAEFLSNRRIPDLNSGFRIFKKEIVSASYNMLPDGFSFTSTLTLLSLHRGYRVHFVPTPYFKREGKSKIKPIKDTLNFLQLIFRTVLYVNPLRIFMPASLFFFTVSMFLFITRVLMGGGFLVTIIITFFCGFELLVVGMLADLIDKRVR